MEKFLTDQGIAKIKRMLKLLDPYRDGRSIRLIREWIGDAVPDTKLEAKLAADFYADCCTALGEAEEAYRSMKSPARFPKPKKEQLVAQADKCRKLKAQCRGVRADFNRRKEQFEHLTKVQKMVTDMFGEDWRDGE